MITIDIGEGGDLTEADFANLVELVGQEVSADPLVKHLPQSTEAMNRIEFTLDSVLMAIEREQDEREAS
jgi:hypothetical protein